MLFDENYGSSGNNNGPSKEDGGFGRFATAFAADDLMGAAYHVDLSRVAYHRQPSHNGRGQQPLNRIQHRKSRNLSMPIISSRNSEYDNGHSDAQPKERARSLFFELSNPRKSFHSSKKKDKNRPGKRVYGIKRRARRLFLSPRPNVKACDERSGDLPPPLPPHRSEDDCSSPLSASSSLYGDDSEEAGTTQKQNGERAQRNAASANEENGGAGTGGDHDNGDSRNGNISDNRGRKESSSSSPLFSTSEPRPPPKRSPPSSPVVYHVRQALAANRRRSEEDFLKQSVMAATSGPAEPASPHRRASWSMGRIMQQRSTSSDDNTPAAENSNGGGGGEEEEEEEEEVVVVVEEETPRRATDSTGGGGGRGGGGGGTIARIFGALGGSESPAWKRSSESPPSPPPSLRMLSTIYSESQSTEFESSSAAASGGFARLNSGGSDDEVADDGEGSIEKTVTPMPLPPEAYQLSPSAERSSQATGSGSSNSSSGGGGGTAARGKPLSVVTVTPPLTPSSASWKEDDVPMSPRSIWKARTAPRDKERQRSSLSAYFSPSSFMTADRSFSMSFAGGGGSSNNHNSSSTDSNANGASGATSLWSGAQPWQSCMGSFPNSRLETFRRAHLSDIQREALERAELAEQRRIQLEAAEAERVKKRREAEATMEPSPMMQARSEKINSIDENEVDDGNYDDEDDDDKKKTNVDGDYTSCGGVSSELPADTSQPAIDSQARSGRTAPDASSRRLNPLSIHPQWPSAPSILPAQRRRDDDDNGGNNDSRVSPSLETQRQRGILRAKAKRRFSLPATLGSGSGGGDAGRESPSQQAVTPRLFAAGRRSPSAAQAPKSAPTLSMSSLDALPLFDVPSSSQAPRPFGQRSRAQSMAGAPSKPLSSSLADGASSSAASSKGSHHSSSASFSYSSLNSQRRRYFDARSTSDQAALLLPKRSGNRAVSLSKMLFNQGGGGGGGGIGGSTDGRTRSERTNSNRENRERFMSGDQPIGEVTTGEENPADDEDDVDDGVRDRAFSFELFH